MANEFLPASVLMTLGLTGCGLFGPCLSINNPNACLSIAIDTDCDTSDPEDTSCPQDTASGEAAEQAETRSEITRKVIEHGVLPADVADRLQP
ncbi:MAG TPA: hypothetical protein QGF58_25805 [Myxococcota bacterium]|nr:hypothetical protein [Myxococcota bacterium]